jgi:ketosteroid isomerase-like protein
VIRAPTRLRTTDDNLVRTKGHAMSDPNIETVQRIYEAFGRGDVATILAEVADDVDWAPEAASSSAPWYGHYASKAVVPKFFEAIGTTIDVTDFAPLAFAANDTDVMVTIRFAFTVRATGRSAAMTLHHWWTFAGGKVVRYRGTEDTEQTAAAFA